jgi:hypothetical protein
MRNARWLIPILLSGSLGLVLYACSKSNHKGNSDGGGAGGDLAGTGGGGAGGSGGGGDLAMGGGSDLAMRNDLAAHSTSASVLQYHLNSSRDGLYVDAAITKAAAATFHIDASFTAKNLAGPTYAQPLFVDGGPGGTDVLYVATNQNKVYAFNAATGAAMPGWPVTYDPPVTLTQLKALPGLGGCGNISPTLGVLGTPVIDLPSRTLFFDAMTTPDGGQTLKHMIYGVSIDDGKKRAGFPVDVSAVINGFDSKFQNQRSALIIAGGTLYVPYGGHIGDCTPFNGWVVAVPLSSPASAKGWSTRATGAGIWAPGGLSSDGTHIFAATGNEKPAQNAPGTWQDSEAIIRLDPGATYDPNSQVSWWAPPNWNALDQGDADIGGTGPMLITAPAATPSQLLVALGKNGYAYLLDPTNLGGISGGLVNKHVSSDAIRNGPASYTTAKGTYVVFKGAGLGCPAGQSGDLTALKISGSPPTITVAWCAAQNGTGSPMVTTSDGHNDAIVWSVGAENNNQLHGFDGDTGKELTTPANLQMTAVERSVTPIAAKGRIFVAASNQLFAFTK